MSVKHRSISSGQSAPSCSSQLSVQSKPPASHASSIASSSKTKHTYALFSALYEPFMGGVEMFTKHLAEELAERGNRVIVVTSRLTPDDPSWQTYKGGVEVVRLPAHTFLGGRLPLSKKNTEYKALMQTLQEQAIDRVVVQTRLYKHSLEGLAFAQRLGVVPVQIEHGSAYITLGNPLFDSILTRYEHWMTRKQLHYAQVFAAISDASRTWLKQFGIEARFVVNNALDASAFKAQAYDAQKKLVCDYRHELNVPRDAPLAAFIGRFTSDKGVMLCAELARRHPDVHMVFAGQGPLFHDLAREEAQLANLHVVGRLDSAHVSALLAQADIFLMPSRSEGFATSLLEACAWGVFPVVTNVGGVAELLGTPAQGFIMEEARISELERGLKAYSTLSKTQAHKHKDTLARRTAETFTWAHTIHQLEQAFACAEESYR